MLKKNLLVLVAILAVLPLVTACGSASPTGPSIPTVPVPTPTPSQDLVRIESVTLSGVEVVDGGVYHLSKDGSYDLHVQFHNPGISGRTIGYGILTTWKDFGNSLLGGPEKTAGNGFGIRWSGAPAGTQTVTIQLVESGGDLATVNGLEIKFTIIFN